MNNLEI